MAIAKALVALLAAVLAAVVPGLLGDQPLGVVGWINVVVLAAGAVQVFNATNLPGWSIAKTIAAAISAAGVIVVSALSSGGISTVDWIQIVLAVVGALGVYAVPNAAYGRHARVDPV